MKEYGFIRVGAAVPELRVGNPKFNVKEIIVLMNQAEEKEIGILTFPELSLTGFTCADLFNQDILIRGSLSALKEMLEASKKLALITIVGVPLKFRNKLYNCGVVIQSGNILGIVPKSYSETSLNCWFASGSDLLEKEINLLGKVVPIGTDLVFCDYKIPEAIFGLEIGQDTLSIIPSSNNLVLNGATVIFSLSANGELVGNYQERKDLIKTQSRKLISGYISVSSGVTESTTDNVFSGSMIIAENGNILVENDRFKFESSLLYQDIDVFKLHNLRTKDSSYFRIKPSNNIRNVIVDIPSSNNLVRKYKKNPFLPTDLINRTNRYKEILKIQAVGLARRLKHLNCQKCVIGISGGLDSTLAFLVIIEAYRMLNISYKNIIAVTLPGFGTTSRTLNNSINLMETYGVKIREISIVEASLLHMRDIGHDKDIHDVTYENIQARERTQILMDIANRERGLVVGTGDLSELALGWCTYNGDHMSMYSVNSGVPKTLVRHLVKYIADTNEDVKNVLYDILDTPISPELLPPTKDGKIKQKTEDKIGPYELHDFFLYHFLRYGATPKKILFLAQETFSEDYTKEEVLKWLKVFLRRFFSQQFKRSCLPDGPKVGTISLSPRGDLMMPSDGDVEVWLSDLEQ